MHPTLINLVERKIFTDSFAREVNEILSIKDLNKRFKKLFGVQAGEMRNWVDENMGSYEDTLPYLCSDHCIIAYKAGYIPVYQQLIRMTEYPTFLANLAQLNSNNSLLEALIEKKVLIVNDLFTISNTKRNNSLMQNFLGICAIEAYYSELKTLFALSLLNFNKIFSFPSGDYILFTVHSEITLSLLKDNLITAEQIAKQPLEYLKSIYSLPGKKLLESKKINPDQISLLPSVEYLKHLLTDEKALRIFEFFTPEQICCLPSPEYLEYLVADAEALDDLFMFFKPDDIIKLKTAGYLKCLLSEAGRKALQGYYITPENVFERTLEKLQDTINTLDSKYGLSGM